MDNIVPGSFQLMKKINTGLIIDVIRLKGPISRAEIAKILNLTPATVTNITAELLNKNIIVESDLGQSTGGRKPILLKINADSYYILSVHIGSTRIRTAVLNMESKIIGKISVKTTPKTTYEEALNIIKEGIERLVNENEINKEKLLGIGIAAHGIVDAEKGKIVYSPNYGWKNKNIRTDIEKIFDVPAFLDRDVRAMALSESWYGAGKYVDQFISVKIGYGVGISLINNKQQMRGYTDGFGEFGHTKVCFNGPLCSCGNRGCIETFSSEKAVERYAAELGLEKDCMAIHELSLMGDERAISAINRASEYLGLAVANLINTFNPQLIVLGGDLIDVNDYYLNGTIENAKKYALPDLFESCDIKRADTKGDAIIKGAAVLVLDNLFDYI
ncbi:MAG: family transcriptional regulator [Caloramator sp.]|jgi:predicted NBD/HSP70 family sugar kinase|uniref:ROK family transcriptional regulator n=1 Tax=Caloramator sp. TaxID=1871330 RepID=UPI001DDFA550|nr:ROK family protein [Caloramator sp.]MBZ4664026.1 family transcriptional regulator [Caloramator sp.]